MKQGVMIIFFSIVTLIYGSVNYYVFSRGFKALNNTSFQNLYAWIYWIITSSFIVGQILERGNPGIFSRVISFIGSYWLAIFLYLLLMVLLVDIVRLIQYFLPFIPEKFSSSYLQGKQLFIYTFGTAFIIVLLGFINAMNPRIHEVNLTFPKQNAQQNELKMVVATDVHLGVLLQTRTAKRLARNINAQNPDVVVLGGDLVDHNPIPVIENNLGKYLEEIKAPLGIYAVTGNHEYIGNADMSVNYLKKHGVEYIRDSYKILDNTIKLVGRNDRESKNYTSSTRKALSEILASSNEALPTILIDHQPVEYDQAVANKIDLMVSGHTHKGQLWPFNYITKMVFENDYGLYQKENTIFYTSNGYGTWGPPVRIGNIPELVVFNIKFE